jgi:hypothetical protein
VPSSGGLPAQYQHAYYQTVVKGHGRIETRQYRYAQDVQGIGTFEDWPKLNGMVMRRSTRTLKARTSIEDQFFITSATHNDAKRSKSSPEYNSIGDCPGNTGWMPTRVLAMLALVMVSRFISIVSYA